MKYIKFIMLFVVISMGVASCSMGGGHTRCAAYTMNEPNDNWGDNDAIESKDYKEAELIY